LLTPCKPSEPHAVAPGRLSLTRGEYPLWVGSRLAALDSPEWKAGVDRAGCAPLRAGDRRRALSR
jgi:hypothetical protein